MHTRTKHTLPPTQQPPGLVTVHGENGFHISLLCLGYYHRMHFIFLNCRKGAHVALNLLRKAIKRPILKQSRLSSLGRRSLTKDKTSIEELLRQNFVQDLRRKPKFLEKL